MDPPPLPPTATTTAAAATTTVAAAQLMNYPDPIDSSPRFRQADTWDEPLPAVPGAKLRLMCSYGGHIIPRPHDKSLCYVGGDTRIVVADRQSPLADFCSRLSRTLLQGRHFTLKYQLPNEELDSLVSVTTDEDLENMIEEYDRLTSACSSLKPTRLRLFLFPSKPETAASMGSLLDDAKSETWFVDALNGSGLLPRGLSESAVMNNLLELDDGVIVNTETCTDMDAQIEPMSGNNTNKLVKAQDVHSNMPDSPVVETNSSFGSSSSSPSMSNLPPIRVRVDEGSARLYDQMAGLDEQLSQMNVAPPPLPIIIGGSVMVSTGCNSGAGHNEHSGRVLSDDDRSDQGAPSEFRKPPLPLQPVPRKFGQDPYALPSPDSKHAGVYNLPSPDSVTSDSSIASATSFSKHTLCQDPTLVAGRETRPPVAKNFPNNFPEPPSSQVQMQQVPDTMYIQAQQQNQQQQQQQQQPQDTMYTQALQQNQQRQQVQDTMYIQAQQQNQQQQQQQQAQDTMYTQALQQNQQQQQVQDTMYAQALQQNQQQQQQVQDTMYAQALQQNQQQQQQQQFIHASTHYIHHPGTNPVPISSYYPIYTTTSSQQPQLHPQMDPQYQTYYMPVPQNQAYNVTVQSNIGDPTTNPANNVAAPPQLYPTKAASLVSTKPEMVLNAPYRTGTPTLVQVPSNQFQSQYVMSQTPHYPPAQPTAAAAASNYGYEYAKATQEQVNYYPQHSVVAMPSQYQTMTSAAAVLLSQASAQQQAAENANQQIGSSQPL